MNLNSNLAVSPEPRRRSWTWIAGVSAVLSALSLLAGTFVLLPPLGLLAAFLLVGALGGALSTRQAWLSGIIIGFPLGLQQLTRYALQELGSLSATLAQPDYWRLVVPASAVATGVAILGAMTGAWLGGALFRPAPRDVP
jgi:hypothetical protein